MSDKTLKDIAVQMQRSNDILLAMAEKDGLKTKTADTSHTAQRLYGDTGLFSVPGLERDIITAHVRPYGIASRLPWIPSVNEDPRFGTITGISDDIGAEVDNACEDAPTGYLKACNLTARFGMIRRDTETIEMDKVMLRLNRGDPKDLALRGRLLGLQNLEPSGMNEGEVMNIITMSEMVNTAVRSERLLNNWTWQGVTTQPNQFPGLDVQIATGQTDADTGVACPAIDSYVGDYGLAEITAAIVNAVSTMEYHLTYNAQVMGLDPASWVVVMRPDLWMVLSSIWPIAYNTNRGAYADTNGVVNVLGTEMVAARDSMRRNMTIEINGMTYPVVTDTGVYEHNPDNNQNLEAGQFASSIYMVPETIQGSFPVTYFEYVDYRQAIGDISLLRGREDFFWTDQGRYSWAIEQIKWCYKLAVKLEPRVILRAPHLAGRIDSVMYSPVAHLRDSDPDSAYWKDGGVSLRTGIGDPDAVWG